MNNTNNDDKDNNNKDDTDDDRINLDKFMDEKWYALIRGTNKNIIRESELEELRRDKRKLIDEINCTSLLDDKLIESLRKIKKDEIELVEKINLFQDLSPSYINDINIHYSPHYILKSEYHGMQIYCGFYRMDKKFFALQKFQRRNEDKHHMRFYRQFVKHIYGELIDTSNSTYYIGSFKEGNKHGDGIEFNKLGVNIGIWDNDKITEILYSNDNVKYIPNLGNRTMSQIKQIYLNTYPNDIKSMLSIQDINKELL